MPNKYIYFPPAGESGTYSFPTPIIVYHSVNLPDNKHYIHVASDEDQALAGRGHHVDRTRVMPFSDERWEKCQQFMKFKTNAHEVIRTGYADLLKEKEIPVRVPLFDPHEIAMDALKRIANYEKGNPLYNTCTIQIAEEALNLIGVME